MQCFLVGSPGREIESILSDAGHGLGLSIVTAPDLAALRTDRRFAAASRPLVIVADAPRSPLDAATVTAFAEEQAGRSFTLLVADAIEPDLYKRLMRTGGGDWVRPHDLAHDLREIVGRMAAAPAPRPAASVVACLPSKGGVGNTSVVIEIASHLAGRRKRDRSRIAILDLNLQGGTIADALDLEPRFDVAAIMDRPERLDEHLVDVFASRHARGFDLFASSLNRISAETIRPEPLFAFIDALAGRYGIILFDLPVAATPWIDDLLRGSDAVIVCGRESVPELRRMGSSLAHLDALGIPDAKVAAVVNGVGTGTLGRASRGPLIAKALTGRQHFVVRRDSDSTRRALDVGRPLMEVAPHSRIARDMQPIGRWVETIIERRHQPRRATTRRGVFA